ncbi:hypothetical protein MCEREM21A_02231 [Sphingomonadaceae bacterium]
MTLDGEDVVDCGVGGNEALGLALGFEALHLGLSSSDRKMRVFAPFVVAQLAVAVLVPASHDFHRSPV